MRSTVNIDSIAPLQPIASANPETLNSFLIMKKPFYPLIYTTICFF